MLCSIFFLHTFTNCGQSIGNEACVSQELHEACGRGELDCPEPKNSTDVDDTEMSPTTEELEEGEDCEDGVQDSVWILYIRN